MRIFLALVCIVGCLLVPAAYAVGQSQGSNTGSQATGAQGAFGSALSNLDNAVNTADAEFTPQDEYYLGRAVAANILAAYRPYTANPELTRYVNRICQTIVINSPQPALFKGYYVMVLDSPEFNAFATPGGHIFLTRKLVETATSEDMLAAVIAHELAHIMLKHSIAIINEMRFMDDMSATAGRAANIAGQQTNAAKQAAYFRNSVTASIDTMIKNGYSQEQEFQADRMAAGLLAVSGYNPAALVEMLRVLQQMQSAQRGGFNTTHPSPAQRISNVQGTANQYRVQDTSASRAARFRNK
ncbi:MAG: M48 family metalloprotease [Treponema sp.]|nr:M48 family metalloprotease [Treponema sp.]